MISFYDLLFNYKNETKNLNQINIEMKKKRTLGTLLTRTHFKIGYVKFKKKEEDKRNMTHKLKYRSDPLQRRSQTEF